LFIFAEQMTAKFFSLFISSLILAQSFNIHISDILKLDELMEHAQFHKEEYGDTIFTFLSKHYGEMKTNHTNNDQEEDHKQLPFNHDYNFGFLTAFVMNKVKYSIEETKEIIYPTSNFFYQETYSSFVEYDIFQPPKQA